MGFYGSTKRSFADSRTTTKYVHHQQFSAKFKCDASLQGNVLRPPSRDLPFTRLSIFSYAAFTDTNTGCRGAPTQHALFHILHSPISAFLGSYLPTMAYRPHAGLKTCVIDYGDSTLNTTRGRSSLVLLARGFGASGGNDRSIFEAPCSALVKAALESSGGDLGRATSDVFQQRLAKLQEEGRRTRGQDQRPVSCR